MPIDRVFAKGQKNLSRTAEIRVTLIRESRVKLSRQFAPVFLVGNSFPPIPAKDIDKRAFNSLATIQESKVSSFATATLQSTIAQS